MKCRPRYHYSASGVAWPVVVCGHAANGIFVHLDLEGMSDLVGQCGHRRTWIAALHLDDSRSEFGMVPRTGVAFAWIRRKEQAILAIDQCVRCAT